MRRVYALSMTYAVILALIYVGFQNSNGLIGMFSHVIFPLTSGAVFAIATFLLKTYGYSRRDPFQRIWLCMFVAVALLFFADLLWSIMAVTRGETFPVEAGILNFGVFTAFFLTLTGVLRLFRLEVSWKELISALVVVVVFGLIVFYVFLFSSTPFEGDVVTLALRIFTPFLDITLFTLSLLAILTFWKGKLTVPFFLVSFGIILHTVADVLFAYTELHGSFYPGHPLELFWLWSYIVMVTALYTFTKELKV
ncbi:hypothetical protein DRO50_02675 [Candidatus Bathyarchaeota archaeon]|nr:MAG: hypothetical protein DRO50_02675 [Candidatus Bathyarchaeota archaeon]